MGRSKRSARRPASGAPGSAICPSTSRPAWGVAHDSTPRASTATSWVAPQFMGNFGGNYDHLARVWEWHVVGGEDEAPE